jgi:hypothetical protein
VYAKAPDKVKKILPKFRFFSILAGVRAENIR